jgi:hypothetical protein
MTTYNRTFDTSADVVVGSKNTLTATLTAPVNSTYSITGGSFTLTSSGGVVLTGPVAVTGYQANASAQVNAYYLLDSVALGLLPGNYSGLFLVTVVNSSTSETQNVAYNVEIRVNSPFVESPATYDITTLTGQTRLFCGDTDTARAIFDDAEISFFLSQSQNNTKLAASFAYEAIASNNSKLTALYVIGEYRKDMTKLAVDCRAQAKELRKIAIISPIVNSPDRVFRPSYECQGGSDGNMKVW